VAWHRAVLLGSPLLPPQVEGITLIEQHIRNRSGKVITIRSARQTMKNECSAMVQLRALTLFRSRGGTYVRTAPTWKPQILNSKLRLERFLAMDPLIGGRYTVREGNIVQCGRAMVQFLSADRSSNVVGATADIALDVDEAHKVDRGKFDEDFLPMTAFKNVPTVLWGVAADKRDLLYEYRQHNEEQDPRLNLQYPAHVWCELNLSYAKHYQEQVSRLGSDHPVILTQYDLRDVDAVGGYLKDHHLMKLLSGDHDRCRAPLDFETYVIGVDIAGEDEEESEARVRVESPRRDSTVAIVAAVDAGSSVHDLPAVRVRDIYWWTGRALGDQQEDLLAMIELWKPLRVVVDARGIGEQLAGYLKRRVPSVRPYKADLNSVSEDCYRLLSFLNAGQLTVFRNDDSPEYRELVRQARRTSYEILQHDRMRIVKPSAAEHIDFMKALHNVVRAASSSSPPVFAASERESPFTSRWR